MLINEMNLLKIINFLSNMANILNSRKDGLALFDNGVTINYALTKWKNAKKGVTRNGNTFIVPETRYDSATGTSSRLVDIGSVTTIGTPNITIINSSTNESWDAANGSEESQKHDLTEAASMGLRELNKFINDHNFAYILTKTGRFGTDYITPNEASFAEWKKDEVKELKFIDKVKLLFKKTEKPEMDVISFFANIKATSKNSFNGYVNRVEKYLTAIHNAKIIGQDALVEKLSREMIANKYESFLAAEGYYHVVTEQQVADFVKKSERGISLDYMKNFIRPIPANVVNKIAEADKLEVFDNYVIMHYDPKGKARQDTANEEAKKRDPIVFGVIAGSTKLYYITDWIDEYCDLTLEKFVDTLKITKDDLIEDEEKKAEVLKEKKAAEKETKKVEKKEVKKTTKKTAAKKEEKPKSKKVDEAVKKDVVKQTKKKK